MSQVVIFGGGGFLGRGVVAKLARLGLRVRIIVRHPERCQKLLTQGDIGQISIYAGDVTRKADVRRQCQQATAIINLVGILAPTAQQNFTLAHVQAAQNIADVAAELSISKVIQISAIGADPQASAVYARTKGLAEHSILQAVPTATILRPSLVFGPEDASFNLFAKLARRLPIIPVFGAQTKFQPVYVGDVCAAILACLQGEFARSSEGKTFELGGTKIFTMKDMQRAINQAVGRHPLLYPMPNLAAKAFTILTGWLPGAPLTRDQLKLLSVDNIVTPGMPGLTELGIQAQPPFLTCQQHQIPL